MSDHDDFAQELRAMARETIPVRRVVGREALATVQRRRHARAVRGALGASACFALVAVGAVGVLPRLDGQQAVAGAESAISSPSVTPYEGGPITEDHYKEIVEYAAACLRDKGYPAGPVEKRIDGVSYGFELHYPAGTPYRDSTAELLACEADVNLKEAEVVYTTQVRLLDVARDKAFAEFAECLAVEDVIVAEEDTLATVMDKAQESLATGGRLGWTAMCLDGYTPRLYG